jgi:hypothetical protein
LVAFTIAAGGEPRINRVELRNSVLVISDADSKAAVYVAVTRRGPTMGTAVDDFRGGGLDADEGGLPRPVFTVWRHGRRDRRSHF